MINYFNIIHSSIITEKAVLLNEKFNKYAVYVSSDANKQKIKKALKVVFGLDVVRINVLNQKGKRKYFKGIIGRRKGRKKVYFSLLKDQNFKYMGIK
ncbi:50S ribosomal protein L23 [Ehrlichia ruminantium]|uniref:Large ribosomal subunit protein uL23 n=1 Tax=Ehrlichia ruminantium TaxID=779 RepID=A0AAE6Q981_EHRRU|nr:50S ribosomal protein L23 [Ehrlichia ruminantium]QGR02667.1 50S ribosomal protein L23 [Ehrlichia ruminantium]QGR03587.1 50S ribosomal protein L23 [Ehrlichia ruminantium]QGR04514.1 50S ribosomal protein L23 [Ehrlichia ruminantium]